MSFQGVLKMSICKSYRREIQTKSREKRSSQQGSTISIDSPWCSHPQSPVTEKDASSLGGATLLQCRGDEEKCQLQKP